VDNTRITRILAALLILVAGGAAWAAQVDYYNYQQFGGAWVDAEKMPKNSSQDSLMCWAAAGSNVLAWTGWTTTGLTQTDDIFKYYQDHWTNEGGLMEYGWNWWFDGVNPSQGWSDWSQVDVPGGNFFPTKNIDNFLHTEYNTTTALSTIAEYLREGYGTALGIYTDSGGGHAITAWGYKYDNVTGQISGIWISDSDDDKYSNTPPDTLDYYGVTYNSSKSRWELTGGYTNWYIGTVQGLARADATYWTGSSGSWTQSSRWQNGVPTSSKIAFIGNNTTATISAAASASNVYVGYESGASYAGTVQLNSGSLTIGTSLYVGFMSGATGTLNMAGGSLSAPSEHIGDGGTGTLTQSSSTNTVASTLYVGYAVGGAGKYNLNGGALTVNAGGSIRIGANSGSGRFAWYGGTITTPSFVLGTLGTLAMGFNFDAPSLASGSLFAGGGALTGLSSSTLEISNSATASESSGTVTVKYLNIGGATTSGRYSLSAGQLNISTGGSIRVGADGGTGRFDWYGGNITAPSFVLGTLGTLAMGFNFDATSLASGSLFAGGGTLTGLSSATLEVTNNATATENSGALGVKILNIGGASASGKYSLSAGQLNISTGGSIRVGADGGTGRFEWYGGTIAAPSFVLGAAGTLAMGFDFNVGGLTSGTLYGGGAFSGLSSATLEVTNNATATENSGTLAVKYLNIGGASTGGKYSMSAGQLTVSAGGSIRVGADGGAGRFAWLGGTIDTTSFVLGTNGTLAMGYNFNVGSLTAGTLFAHAGSLTGLSSSTLEIMNNATGTQNSALTGALHYLVIGSANGGGTYNLTSGQLNVNAGGSIRVGADGGAGQFVMNGGTVVTPIMTLGANGTITVGAGGNFLISNTGIARLEWLGGTITATSISMDATGVLAMGINFNAGDLASGAIFGGLPVNGLSSSTLEVFNAATATEDSGVVTVGTLNIGGLSTAGTYSLSAGQLVATSGGAIRVGADGGAGRLAWFGGTISTPSLVLGANGTLAMGFNFNMANLVDGSLIGGGSLTVLGAGAVEIANNAVASQNSGVSGLSVLRIGGSGGAGTYNITAGQLTLNAGGSIRIGADGGAGRFEWYGGTISAPSVVFGANGTLAMGYNFNVAGLANGSLWGGSVSGLSSATLEIINGATATDNSGTFSIGGINIGGTSSSGKFTLSVGQLIQTPGGQIRVGADGGTGRFEWLGGTISNANMVIGPNATLAMGLNFNIANLLSGAIFTGGGSVSGLPSATFEMVNWGMATQDTGVFTVGTLNLGGASSFGKYTLNGGQLVISPGGSLRIGADGTGNGRFAWNGGTIDTPLMIFGTSRTLAMGFSFNVADLSSGNIFVHGGTVTGLNLAILEITNNATATENSGTFSVRTLNIGGSSTSGTYMLTGGQLTVPYGSSISIGTAGGTGRFAWYGGSVATSSMVVGANGTLAMGFNFDINALTSGGLFVSGGTLSGLSSGTLEVTNGAAATQNANSVPLHFVRIGGAGGAGKWTLTGGQLNINAGGSIRVGADGADGRFAWYGGTIVTPTMVLGSAGTLAMGYNFNVGSLTSGGLFAGGGTLSGLSDATLEITNGATATGNSGALNVRALNIGGFSSSGKYTLSAGQVVAASGGSIRIGADGGVGRLEWLGGTITTPSMVLGSAGALAMGYNFNVGSLISGGLFTGGGTLSGLSSATVEVMNGATATENGATILNVGNLNIGGDAGTGTYVFSAGQLHVSTGGALRVGSAANAGRLEWYGGWLTAPSTVFANSSSLAMGFNFSVGNLVAGALTGGPVSGLSNASLEIVNGATATHNSGALAVANLDIANGKYALTNGQINVGAGGAITVGSTTQGSEFDWYGGSIDTPAMTFIPGSTLMMGYNFSVGALTSGAMFTHGGTVSGLEGTTFIVTNGAAAAHAAPDSLTTFLLMAGYTGGVGSYVMQGGNLDVQFEGLWAGGSFTMNGGDNNITGPLGIGMVSGPQAVFTQNGGVCTVQGAIAPYSGLYLGFGYGSGVYNFNDGTLTVFADAYVGDSGTGAFNQVDGQSGIAGGLYVGKYAGSNGAYHLSGGLLTVGQAQLATASEYIGYNGAGEFHQTGGTHTIVQSLYLGYESLSTPLASGTYNLEDGDLTVEMDEYLGYAGVGTFNQSGGTNTATSSLGLWIGGGTEDSGSYSSGTYNLSGGTLTIANEAIGYYGTGTFIQTGGYNNVVGEYGMCVGFQATGVGEYRLSAGINTITNTFWIAYAPGSHGAYYLSGAGQLIATNEYVAYDGTGVVNQSGGIHTVTNALNIGTISGQGTYNLSGGLLYAKNITLGSHGLLNVTDNSATIKVTGTFSFASGSVYGAVAGATMELTGAGLDIITANESALAGLINTAFLFDGGNSVLSHLEVASAIDGGFTDNFAIGALALGSVYDIGRVRLLDFYNNGNRGAYGRESLFTNSLLINTGSYLDLNGYAIYVAGNVESALDAWIAANMLRDATLGGGYYLDAVYNPANSWTEVVKAHSLTGLTGPTGGVGDFRMFALMSPDIGDMGAPVSAVPEPSTLLLFAVALAGLAGIARRKMR
jgi:hypothetical protein